MNRWTDSAQAELDQYSARVRRELRLAGVDADEVAEDLRRHVHAEVEAEKLPLVTAQDVSRILARIGTPKLCDEEAEEPSQPKGITRANGAEPRNKPPGFLLLLFGVILPFGTIVFEFLTGACAAVLFDPLPTLGHALLTLLVPGANLGVWLALRRADGMWRGRLGWASGLSLGVSGFYALLFLPFTPFALIGILVYGAGLVPLSPAIAFLCAALLRRRLRRQTDSSPLPGLAAGSLLGAAAVVLLALPLLMTRIGISMAASESPAETTRGVRLLRSWGQHEELLRECYSRRMGISQFYLFGNRVTSETARTMYYRVYGRAFNSVPPPKLYAGRARWSVLEEEFTWDSDQGGQAVAGRIKGLSLSTSRQDGFINEDAAVSYVEWTMEFQNVSARQREARAQILLPPGGVVSRLTLWINGEEREAAFAGRSQVRAAYEKVVADQRDPGLITTCGPDRVLIQCFPVPRDGGKMKVRLGITAPLVLTDGQTGLFRVPLLLERNFSVADELRHSVWLKSKGLVIAGAGWHLQPGGSARGELSESQLQNGAAVLQVKRPGDLGERLFADTHSGDEVRQRIVRNTPQKLDRLGLAH